MSLKIMVVDNEEKTSKLMRAVATPNGHAVASFQDSETARQRGVCDHFDVVFAAMGLPTLNGVQLIGQLRQTKPNQDSTFVMLSAKEDVSAYREAFREGANFILAKPLAADRLTRMLGAMSEPGWKDRRPAARLPLFTPVTCKWNDKQISLHSMNISESGMLLQPSLDAAEGETLDLTFRIADVNATLNVAARIVRKDGTRRLGVEFTDLPPESRNAIRVFVMGRPLENSNPGIFSELGARRLYRR